MQFPQANGLLGLIDGDVEQWTVDVDGGQTWNVAVVGVDVVDADIRCAVARPLHRDSVCPQKTPRHESRGCWRLQAGLVTELVMQSHIVRAGSRMKMRR